MSERVLLRPWTGRRLETPRGHYKRVEQAGDRGGAAVSICCPACGHGSWLQHEIAADGTVSPSVECPWEGCTWHVYVTLEGWTP